MLKFFTAICIISALPIAAEINVLAFSGSTREDSINKKLLEESAKIAREQGAKVTLIDLNDYPMPFYDGDIEAKQGLPANAKRLQQQMIVSDAILISTPEYNGSIPAVLKNAIDWLSRGEGGKPSREAFQGKKIAVMSASPGKGRGAKALSHLCVIIENIGGTIVKQQVSVSDAQTAFDSEGHLLNAQAKEKLTAAVKELLREN